MTARPSMTANPLRPVLDLFSSVRFGIVLLVLLFVYCTIGSAGIVYPIHANLFTSESWVHAQLRTWRPFEMTEFEWFHWWPFNLLIALICVTLIVTTLRRIRLSVVNLGVWMIHTGIVVLCIGSVIYFSRKVEGDAAVVRRQVMVEVDTPSGPMRASLLAMPGANVELDTPGGPWRLEVLEIDPAWEIRSGDDAGRSAYSVNVLVQGPGQRFMRQLLADHPQYTEDVLFTDDPKQPMQRAVKATGKPLVTEALRLALAYEPARWFQLKNDADKSWALLVRRPGDAEWHQRPIEGLPLYNDYIASRNQVFEQPGQPPSPIDPIDVAIPPASAHDPFPDVTFRATGYLRYATQRTELVEGPVGMPLNPAVRLSIGFDEKQRHDVELLALDPARRRADQGIIAFRWIDDPAKLAAMLEPPTLEFEVRVPTEGGGETLVRTSAAITDLARLNPQGPFIPIDGTDYGWRAFNVEDDIELSSGTASVAIVELASPRGTVTRWVFDDPALTRDVKGADAASAIGAGAVADERITVRYRPGAGRAVLTVVAGPGERDLGLVIAASNRKATHVPLRVGEPVAVGGGLSLVATKYLPRALLETRPLIVPRQQRMRDAGEFFAQVQIAAEGGRLTVVGPSEAVAAAAEGVWLPFHRFAFDGPERVLRRHPYQPTVVRTADGRDVEMLFSRQRRPLPAPVALDDFRLATHVGGFTGETATIRNYTSVIRFDENAADDNPRTPTTAMEPTWGAPVEVSVNEPIERDGWWFFQAQWDPPDEARAAGQRASAGLNYTVLGVGNREGVWVQLAGCIIAVAGMIYAFYVKPMIKRRRQLAVEARVAEMAARGELPVGARVRGARSIATLEPVEAGGPKENRS